MENYYQNTWYHEVEIMDEDMKKKDYELLTRIALRIEQYQKRHECTKVDLSEHFIRHIAFNPNNNSFRLDEVQGWKVIEQDDFDNDVITIHEFYTENDANKKFEELYPNGADKKAKKYLLYQAPVDLNPKAGAHSAKEIDLSKLSDSDALTQIVVKGAKPFSERITEVLKTLKDEKQTGITNSTNPKSLEEAIHKRKELQKSLEETRAKHVFELLRDSPDKGKYLVDETIWSEQQMVTGGDSYHYPNPKNDTIEVTKVTGMSYSLLLEFDRFLSDRMEVSIGMVLATVHPIMAKKVGENPDLRPSLSSPKSDFSEIKIGRHLGSNLREMVEEMAYNGWDVQPIFDRKESGHCIGRVKLSDVAGLLSDKSFILREDSKVDELRSYGLILPPPPQLDASIDLSVAGNILHHGYDCIIVSFNPDPENWSGSSSEFDQIKERLESGYHIMVAHDIIAYRLNS